ncbi:FHA domain-containing protein [Brasilonema bromeliae]|uniref:FHA domain-containing protein n=1 Tax=Brasilonema bromeliae SPC951 TaxID=385972 RepID=A0ABX1P1H5_9CYAN|nr:FHA domain-containing protein [Brasilonema bromeliae]NMG18160.1 FHA domain-containing protein [Brasilonema bromeliae SPC951]
MPNLSTSHTTGQNLELFHLQSNTSFELPPNLPIFRIGKPNEEIAPDINVLALPNADVVSRLHAEIQVEENIYYIIDTGSSNGTFLNSVKLEPKKRYPLNLGDKIDLGQQEKITFIFQQKQNFASTSYSRLTRQPTVLQAQIVQPEMIGNNKQYQVDRPSKLVGLVLMVLGILIISTNTRIGFFIGLPSILLCLAGVIVLSRRHLNRKIGWILIGLGVAIMLFTGNFFASVNLFAILASSAFLFAGYQLFNTGKVLNYSLHSLKGFLKR